MVSNKIPIQLVKTGQSYYVKNLRIFFRQAVFLDILILKSFRFTDESDKDFEETV